MVVCKQCGVELEEHMQECPLCENSVRPGRTQAPLPGSNSGEHWQRPALLKHILWQIGCVLLLSGIIATLIINLSIVGRVTWSIYPVTICLIVFCYASLVALWKTKLFVQVLTGWMVSSALLAALGILTEDRWPTSLALPILCAVNVVCLMLLLVLRSLKVKGLNVLALIFVAIAVLCLLIEGIITLYQESAIGLSWSVIVAACLLPVTAAIIFMYLRTRNNKDLQKIFHT